MTLYAVLVFLTLTVSSQCFPHRFITSKETSSCYPFPFVPRVGWNARAPTDVTQQKSPSSLVIIHHSYIPGACYNRAECSQAMRSMQNAHQITNGWNDIGYNFAVGSDGVVYEGRGWRTVGAHAVGFNTNSVGIVFIGNWVSVLPPRKQLQVVQDLIKVGVDRGYISRDYKLIGHRQTGSTECPGEALFNEITSWERFSRIV